MYGFAKGMNWFELVILYVDLLSTVVPDAEEGSYISPFLIFY